MDDVKKIVFEGGGGDATTNALLANLVGKSGIDPSMLAMLNQGNGGFGGQNGMFMMLFLLLLLGRNGGGLLGGGNEAANALNTAENSQLLLQAINGNRDAVRDLAGATNTSITAVNGALAALNTQLATIAGQNNLNSAQVINAIQSGNANLASQLAACCCDIRTTVNEQGFQNRLAELNQTNQLTATMTANHRETMQGFSDLEIRNLQDKLELSRERNTQLTGEISNLRQTGEFYAMLQPINAKLASLECHQLPTYPQQYIPGFPAGGGAVAFGYGYGGYPFGFPGGCGCHGHHHHHGGSSAATPTNP